MVIRNHGYLKRGTGARFGAQGKSLNTTFDFGINFESKNVKKKELQNGLQECGPHLNSFIDHILEKHQLEMKDLLIVGFSQGTIISLSRWNFSF